MHSFVRNLLTEWRKLNLPFAGETFVVAVSGGADSVALLLALNDLRERKKLRNRFVVAHFNHDLRGEESEKDAEFVKSLCVKFGFELAYKIQDSKFKIQEQKGNVEQNARRARYAFLAEIAENLDARGVLTAHTINDQAETFLLNLLRGSGLQGLSAMKTIREMEAMRNSRNAATERKQEVESLESKIEKSKIQNPKSKIQLIRPLLSWAKRIDTENFCHSHEIEFRRDQMNEDLSFSRVRVRKILLPTLAEFNPKIIETLANTAQILRRENEIAEGKTNGRDDREIDWQGERLAIKNLKNLGESNLHSILWQWLKANCANSRSIESKHIEAIARLISSRKSGKIIELPNGESVEKESGFILFSKRKIST